MSQVFEATYQDGVFKPDDRPALADRARVRLTVDPVPDQAEASTREHAWASLEQLWRLSTLDSHGDRLTRDRLHDRR
jgi:predicted DNA-binding antitoxin AbrB/MazE fold protein